MNEYFGWLEIGGSDLFFNPENKVVICPAGIVAQVVIEAQPNFPNIGTEKNIFWTQGRLILRCIDREVG